MLTTLLAILLVCLGLLAIPLGLDYRLNWAGRVQGDVSLVWLFGLVHIHLPADSAPAQDNTAARPTPSRRRRARRKRHTHPLAAWRLRPFRRRLIRFARDLWRAIHTHDLRVQLLIGLDDPADTGQLWAIMGQVAALASYSERIDLDIQPDFTAARLEFNSSGRIRVIPAQLFGLVLALLLSPSFWHGVQRMRGKTTP